MRKLELVVACLAALCLATPLSWAQNTSIYGSIVGNVTDPSGAAVLEAHVTVTNVDTGITTVANTSGAGFYRADGLIAGTYRVEAEHAGFKKSVKEGIDLSSSQTVRADVVFVIGDVTQSVEVTSSAPLINTESGQVTEITDFDDRKYLATSAPSFFSILALAPGDSYQITTGTSVAAAHVSGIAAMLLEEKPSLTPNEVRSIIMSTAKPLGSAGQVSSDFGAGLVDAYQAVSAVTNGKPAGKQDAEQAKE